MRGRTKCVSHLMQSIQLLVPALLLAALWLLLAAPATHAQEPAPAVAPEAAPAATTGTVISQDITIDTTWTEAGSPYTVTQLVTVLPGVKLTIEPGVTIIISPTSGFANPFVVKGALVAEGTADMPIVFTGSEPEPASWGGLEVSNTSEQPAQITLNHVTVEYGELLDLWGGANLVLGHAVANINNSTFRFGGANGLAADEGTTLNLRNSTFTGNRLNAVWFERGLTSDPLFDNLTASQNGVHNAVVYHGVDISSAHRMEVMGLPYVMSGGLNVKEGAKLVLDPGVALRMDTGFYVRGELQAFGTAAAPILLTGYTQTPGSWWGLFVTSANSAASAHLDHVTIEYGGGTTESDSAANLVVSSASVTVTNSIIRNGNNHGIFNSGGAPGDKFTVNVSNTALTGHRLAPVVCDDESCHYQLAGLTVSGNGSNGIVYRSPLLGAETWRNMGVPYIVEESSGVDNGGTLTIEPGVWVQMAQGANFRVAGELLAQGTAQQPITFTGGQEQPGWWQGIQIHGNGVVKLSNCEVGYGGGWGVPDTGMIWVQNETSGLFINDCLVHHSIAAGILVDRESEPLITNNRIENNAIGLIARTRFKQLDVRNNWWGHASGPKHPNNPNGQGQEIIGENVLFDPWLTSPGGGTQGIIVQLSGPGRFSSGETIVYSILYYNNTGGPIQNAVVRFGMPGHALLEEASPGGIFHAPYEQVFWKLGDLPDGAQGLLYVKVLFDRGLPDGLRSVTAVQLSGTNLPAPLFNVQEYLSYTPRTLQSVVELSVDEVNALRVSAPELETLYQQAIASGFKFGDAERQVYSTGQEAVEVRLLRFNPQMNVLSLWLTNGAVHGALVDGSSYTVLRNGQAVRFDVQTNAWSPVTPGALQLAMATDGLTWSECVQNCIEDKLPGYIIKKKIKTVSDLSKVKDCTAAAAEDESAYLGCAKIVGKVVKKLSPVSEGIDLGQCNGECQLCAESGGSCENPNCHCCTEDKYRCSADDFIYATLADREVIKMKKCVIDQDGEETWGTYLAEVVIKICADCEKCVMGGAGRPVCVAKTSNFAAVNTFATLLTLAAQQGAQGRLEITAESDGECDECRAAKDPNEMYGPAGDLLPGQLVTYEVAYENVGAGIAFGVFVANKLPEGVFDLATLQINNGGSYSAGAGTIFWEVGDLAPTGQPGASGKVSYSVRLRGDLPSGTPVTNQAVVHFPSVPEETPTNRLTNLIKPLAADPQSLQTEAGQPVAVTLSGRDAANAPLTYAVVEGPLHGTLSGSAPNLVYTPDINASGLDQIRFTVSNGASTSARASVNIQILPSASDVTGPAVKWTAPVNGENINLAVLLAGMDDKGNIYYPVVQAQFNEAVDPATVTSQTVIVTDSAGKQLAAEVRYDGTADQLQLMLREQPQVGQAYAVTITTGVKDLRGNPLSATHAWSFQIASVGQPDSLAKIYLPMIAR